MTENTSPRSVHARLVHRAMIITGDGNAVGAAAVPPRETESSPDPLARALNTATRADELCSHASALAARVWSWLRFLLWPLLR